MSQFGQLLHKYRQRCRDPQHGVPLTQARLAELLSLDAKVLGYSGATISNWERGKNQIRRDDWHILISLIRVLFACGGVHTVEEINQLLLLGNYRPLNEEELQRVNPSWRHSQSPPTPGITSLSADEQEGLLPPATYSQLFGLEEAREQILFLLMSSQSPHLVVIVGIGGIGKTALADTVARKAIHTAHFDRVIWLSAETVQDEFQVQQTTASLFRSIIDALGQHLLAGKPLDHNLSRRQLQIRSALKQRRCLVIIDNLEDQMETNWLLGQLQGLTGPSKFLLTARHHPSPDTEAHIFPLPQLHQTESVALLRYQAQLTGVNAFDQVTDDELMVVHQTIGGHPQALRLVARLARMYPLAQILTGWVEGQAGYIAQVYESIYAPIWKNLTANEQQLLQTMLLVAQTGGTTDQLQTASGLPGKQFWPALTRLIEFCLVEPRGSSQTKRYGIHSLTSHFLQSQQEMAGTASEALFHQVILTNISYWQQYLEQLTEKQWPVLDIERANLFQAIRFSLIVPETVITPGLRESWQAIADRLFSFIEQRGFATEWIPLLEKVIDRFGQEPRPQCQLLNQLGKLYRLVQQLPQAIAVHQKAEQLAQRIEDEAEVAHSSFNLGTDYLRHRNYERADQYGQKALAIFTRLGRDGRETAATLNLLGTVAQACRDLPTSAQYLQQAVTIWQQMGMAPELARTLNNLALTYQEQEKIDEALHCYAEARHVLSKTTSETDKTLILLSEGSLYFDLQRYHEAETTFQKINLTFLRTSGHDLYQALTLNNLGNIAFVNQDYVLAETLLQQSISLWRDMNQEIELANTLSRLGDVYLLQKQTADAERCFGEVITLAEQYPQDERAKLLQQEAREQLGKMNQQKKEANQYLG